MTSLGPGLSPDSLAPEEINTPDPTSFPDDILAYLTTTPEEARAIYDSDLITHVTTDICTACQAIMILLQSELAYDVFVPRACKGIDMVPYHLDVKPGLPDYPRARARPVREALFQNAKTEFDRMRTYFNSLSACNSTQSNSSIYTALRRLSPY